MNLKFGDTSLRREMQPELIDSIHSPTLPWVYFYRDTTIQIA
jgi:hypothetical protein